MDHLIRTVEDTVTAAAAAIRAMPDPVKRDQAARKLIDWLSGEALPLIGRIRIETVAELRTQGLTYSAIGDLLGIGYARAQQLAVKAEDHLDRTTDQAAEEQP